MLKDDKLAELPLKVWKWFGGVYMYLACTQLPGVFAGVGMVLVLVRLWHGLVLKGLMRRGVKGVSTGLPNDAMWSFHTLLQFRSAYGYYCSHLSFPLQSFMLPGRLQEYVQNHYSVNFESQGM